LDLFVAVFVVIGEFYQMVLERKKEKHYYSNLYKSSILIIKSTKSEADLEVRQHLCRRAKK